MVPQPAGDSTPSSLDEHMPPMLTLSMVTHPLHVPHTTLSAGRIEMHRSLQQLSRVLMARSAAVRPSAGVVRSLLA